MKEKFIIAYCWLFGETKKRALEVWKEATPDYIVMIVETWKRNYVKMFYED